jgi:hypothetical protein
MKKDFKDKAIKKDISLDSRDSKRMSSAIDKNEKFFEELATAYVDRDGEELKQDVYGLPPLSTERLEWKVKQGLKSSNRERRNRKRRNRTIILSTLAAVFAMVIIYNAVIPTMILDEPEWAAEAPAEEAEVMAPEVAEDEDIAMEVAEPELEDAPADADDEVAIADDVEDLPPEIFEPPHFEGIFASGFIVQEFEASLPEGFSVTEQEFLEDSTRLSLISATNQPIVFTETAGGQLEREIQQNAEILEVNDVQVFMNVPTEGEYQLHFVAMNSVFVIEGSDIGELITVVRAVINVPELSGGYDIEDGISDETALINLPRGLITIVPLQ